MRPTRPTQASTCVGGTCERSWQNAPPSFLPVTGPPAHALKCCTQPHLKVGLEDPLNPTQPTASSTAAVRKPDPPKKKHTSKLVLKATAFIRYAPCRLLPWKLALRMSADVKLERRRSCTCVSRSRARGQGAGGWGLMSHTYSIRGQAVNGEGGRGGAWRLSVGKEVGAGKVFLRHGNRGKCGGGGGEREWPGDTLCVRAAAGVLPGNAPSAVPVAPTCPVKHLALFHISCLLAELSAAGSVCCCVRPLLSCHPSPHLLCKVPSLQVCLPVLHRTPPAKLSCSSQTATAPQ